MNHDNQVLLGKLVEISQGKQLSVVSARHLAPVTTRQHSQHASRLDLESRSAVSRSLSTRLDSRKLSLNIENRKKEIARIESENHRFAQRLYSNVQTHISRKQLDKDFEHAQNVRKMISRFKKNRPSFNGRFLALPPLK